jgi:putative FmdB family regulatory protein
MPLYEARCHDCDLLLQYRKPVAEYLDTPVCPSCGGGTSKVIVSAPMGFVAGKFEPFKSQVDGSVITCQSDLAEHNKRNNVVNMHDGWSEDKILAGDLGQKKVVPDKKEIAEDLQRAIHDVTQGYKPEIKGADDEL